MDIRPLSFKCRSLSCIPTSDLCLSCSLSIPKPKMGPGETGGESREGDGAKSPTIVVVRSLVLPTRPIKTT